MVSARGESEIRSLSVCGRRQVELNALLKAGGFVWFALKLIILPRASD
jgi:hypothetical protein